MKPRDLSNVNVAATPYKYDVSPGYFEAASTRLLSGRSFSWHDDKSAPPVAVANAEFALKMFGAVENAIGKYCRLQNGTRVQIVGVAEDGKYLSLNEDQQPALFLPAAQSPLSNAFLVVRSRRDPVELGAAMRNKVREVDSGLPAEIQSWNSMLSVVLFPSRIATAALGVLGVMGAMLSITVSLAWPLNQSTSECVSWASGWRSGRREVLQAALGRAMRLLIAGSAAGLLLGLLGARLLAFIVYQASPRDPWVLAGVVLSMLLLGLLATWIPAQRALSVDPLFLLREQ